MSDTVVVLNDGLIQQVGTPVDIYNEPRNRFVANFIGESNIIRGEMLEDYKVKFEDAVFDCVDRGYHENEIVDVVIRPEDLRIVPAEQAKITGVVDTIIFKGVHYEIIVYVNEREYIIHSTEEAVVGSMIGLDVNKNDIHVMEVEGLTNA